MGRTKKQSSIRSTKPSLDTLSSSDTFSSAANSTSVVTDVSSPSQKMDKTAFFKKFSKYESNLIKNIEQKMMDDIDRFEKSCDMIKFAIPVALGCVPLKDFSKYRSKFAVEKIDESEYEGKENIPLHQTSSSGFKKPFEGTVAVSKKTKKRALSTMKTPNNNITMNHITTITPKVDMSRPLSILRHARIGEQAVSLSGSPLMVSSLPKGTVPTVAVPLNDGGVVTMLPSADFEPEHMPSLDEETKGQLKTLYKNLAVFFSNSSSGSDDE